MPAAFTHAYIAHLILERLRRPTATNETNRTVVLALPAVDGSPGAQPRFIEIPKSTAMLILRHPASFCFGAVSPDYFADVITGITTSHQPSARGADLAEYMDTFTRSLDWQNEQQIAYTLGWLTHICADVFGHHWVGAQAGGDFEDWVRTQPEIVRKHIGIEMVWDGVVRAATAGGAFLKDCFRIEFGSAPADLQADIPAHFRALAFERSLIQRAMFTEGQPLCDRFYAFTSSAPAQGQLVQIVAP
jgi:hypothetical protein